MNSRAADVLAAIGRNSAVQPAGGLSLVHVQALVDDPAPEHSLARELVQVGGRHPATVRNSAEAALVQADQEPARERDQELALADRQQATLATF